MARLAMAMAAMALMGCDGGEVATTGVARAQVGTNEAPVGPAQTTTDDGSFQLARRAMVNRQLAARDITDPRVLAAMEAVPRHLFVPPELRGQAYADYPLPIGHEQTISQPYVVAFMSQALELQGHEKVLEIGTGSGYQAAVLAGLCQSVFTMEIVPPLGKRSQSLLKKLGYHNIHVKVGDGYQGWPGQAPFDAIMVTAAPDHVPEPLIEQLAVSGKMVLPVGRSSQHLVVLERTPTGISRRKVLGVQFVPMTGEAQRRPH